MIKKGSFHFLCSGSSTKKEGRIEERKAEQESGREGERRKEEEEGKRGVKRGKGRYLGLTGQPILAHLVCSRGSDKPCLKKCKMVGAVSERKAQLSSDLLVYMHTQAHMHTCRTRKSKRQKERNQRNIGLVSISVTPALQMLRDRKILYLR